MRAVVLSATLALVSISGLAWAVSQSDKDLAAAQVQVRDLKLQLSATNQRDIDNRAALAFTPRIWPSGLAVLVNIAREGFLVSHSSVVFFYKAHDTLENSGILNRQGNWYCIVFWLEEHAIKLYHQLSFMLSCLHDTIPQYGGGRRSAVLRRRGQRGALRRM